MRKITINDIFEKMDDKIFELSDNDIFEALELGKTKVIEKGTIANTVEYSFIIDKEKYKVMFTRTGSTLISY